METNVTPRRLHPALLVMAISVTAFALIGIGMMTGWIPSSSATPNPAAATVNQETSPAAPVAAEVPAAAEKTTAAKTEAPRKHPVHRETVAAGERESGAQTHRSAPACADCGVVESVNAVEVEGKPTGVGAVIGGVAGALLGNQIGHGNGRTLGTIAGAAGGAYAGHEIEKHERKQLRYDVKVRMDGGSTHVVSSAEKPEWQAGDRVHYRDGTLSPAN